MTLWAIELVLERGAVEQGDNRSLIQSNALEVRLNRTGLGDYYNS